MTIEPTNKRARNSSVVLTDKLCQKRVEKRTRIYDRKVPGLFVSIITRGVATLYFKYTDKKTGKQKCVSLGVHSPAFTVENARTEVYGLRTRIGRGENVAETRRQQKTMQVRQGKTLDEVIELRIEFMKTPEKKDDGEIRPKIESWEGVARYLRNFVSPRLGKMLASEVSDDDIVRLTDDIAAGKHGGKASISNARHVRRSCTSLFKWAAQAGNKYIAVNPCTNLPPLARERPKTRVLSEDEIRIFWHGLDREDLPWDKTIRHALRFALVSMLRSNELLPIHRDELDSKNGVVNIPMKRVKKRRLLVLPLSRLAWEIIRESMGNHEYAFAGRFGDAPLSRQAMSNALKGTKRTNGEVKTIGICAALGIAPFCVHDLRRSAATLCERLRLPGADIALCLDHQPHTDANGERTPAITQAVYSLAFDARVARKREVLDAWAAKLREIIAEPTTALRVAA